MFVTGGVTHFLQKEMQKAASRLCWDTARSRAGPTRSALGALGRSERRMDCSRSFARTTIAEEAAGRVDGCTTSALLSPGLSDAMKSCQRLDWCYRLVRHSTGCDHRLDCLNSARATLRVTRRRGMPGWESVCERISLPGMPFRRPRQPILGWPSNHKRLTVSNYPATFNLIWPQVKEYGIKSVKTVKCALARQGLVLFRTSSKFELDP
jgi:hypothetical protein